MATLRTVISDLEEGEASEAIESIDLASDEKVMSITFLRTMATAGTSTDPGASDEDPSPGEALPGEALPEEVLPAEDAPAEDAPAEAPPEDYPRAE
jgi:hypothetical protein